MDLDYFHPAIRRWFQNTFPAPTEAQAKAWPSLKEQRDTLIAAPTGSGKTLAAFLSAVDDLVRQGLDSTLPDETHVVYVSPLKALSNDVQRNLQIPLEGIRSELRSLGLSEVGIRTLVRTGDTTASERNSMIKRPPHILVTTPESLYILLTSEGGRRMLRTARTLIIDEIHAVVAERRGAHLALSVERLQALASNRIVRVGLSATQRPIEEVARFLVGTSKLSESGDAECNIIDTGFRRKLDLAIEVPGSPLDAVMSGEVWDEIYDRLGQLISEHRTTLVFVNTRRMSERVSRHLGERLGDENITSHHGSLSRDRRLQAEQRLKAGDLRALVATSSLELGIDIGSVDLVCQIGSTRSISAFLQRAGRADHTVGGTPKGRLFPTSRDELIECAALLDSGRRGELDQLEIPERPLDVLAQQLVAAVSAEEEWDEDHLYEMVRRAYPYRSLTRNEFDTIVSMLAEGFSTRMGRRRALIHRDGVNRKLRPRRGSRLTAITNGGAIPDNADYDVILEPEGTFIGTVNEDFAVESLQGDIFQLGNSSWRIARVERGKVRVEDAQGQPPSIPFWLGEAKSRSRELSEGVSRLRAEISNRLDRPQSGIADPGSSLTWLTDEVGVGQAAAEQIVDYLAVTRAALGLIPTQQTIVFERFFDEAGGTQLVIHSPFGSRINRAWGLALRKRFCRKFSFELQAAATEDSIVLSLGPTQSFPLEDVFGYLRSSSVRELLIQALLNAPMFALRWRWVTSRALAVPRWRGGKKVPPQFQRIEAEDLLAVLFPDQLACVENLSGDREVPDHPLVSQTIKDCLTEAMDVQGLERLLASIETGNTQLVARDVTEPSPLAQEVLNARPYAFLDDAPLEERRTQAVLSRRWMGAETASDLGTLDSDAIRRVAEEAWPVVESPDELHDALMQLAYVICSEGRRGLPVSGPAEGAGPAEHVESWEAYFEQLRADRRAVEIAVQGSSGRIWVAAERLPQVLGAFSGSLAGDFGDVENPAPGAVSPPHEALVEVLRSRLEGFGPITVEEIVEPVGLGAGKVEQALLNLEAEGFVMRGRFRPERKETEWCVRRLLARIHRYTLDRLRKEIEPVSSADFMRFLFDWQRVSPEHQANGAEGLMTVIEQLEGFEAPAAAWEGDIFPARLPDYDPAWLDSLCSSGRVVWLRLSPPRSEGMRTGPIRTTPISFLGRKSLPLWTGNGPESPDHLQLSPTASPVFDSLLGHGASFFADVVESTRLLEIQVEEGLGELVARGLVTADSFAGLRAILTPSSKRLSGSRRSSMPAVEHAGRWSRIHRGEAAVRNDSGARGNGSYEAERLGKIALTLLRRYGVIFRRLLDRESVLAPWRDLLRIYRRLEARGEIRGGRFVAGHSGEQFALPEAVGLLRKVRRTARTGELVSLSAADPLNLIGIVTPGDRLATMPSNRVLYRDGIPIAVLEAKEVQYLTDLDRALEWRAKKTLIQRRIPPQLRYYLRP